MPGDCRGEGLARLWGELTMSDGLGRGYCSGEYLVPQPTVSKEDRAMARAGEAIQFWPSEKKRHHDPATGAAIWQMTDYPAVNHSLYFTNPSFTPNGRF